jgi:hypothetical protein
MMVMAMIMILLILDIRLLSASIELRIRAFLLALLVCSIISIFGFLAPRSLNAVSHLIFANAMLN